MAFYDPSKDEEDDEQLGQQTSAPSAVIGSGVGATQSGAAPEPAGSTPPKAEPFVGISQYINANKPQSEKLAGQVVGNIDQKAGAVDSALNSATNSFNQAAEKNRVQADTGLFDQVKSNAASVAADQEKAKKFAALRDASYSGPQKLEDIDSGKAWSGIQTALQKAKQAKEATGTEEGRMGLIKEISNNPRQSQGGLVFDNLLLQSNPNSAGALQKAGASLGDIDQRLGSAQTSAQAKAKELSDLASGTKNQARNALTSGYGDLRTGLVNKADAMTAQQKAEVDGLREAIQTGKLTPDQISKLGLDPNLRLYGNDPSKFVNYHDDVDIYSAATADDVARQNALMSLAGDVDLGAPILNPAAKIGTTGKGFTIDNEGLQGAQAAGKAKYDATMNQPGSANTYKIPTVDGKVPGSKGFEKGWGPNMSLSGIIKMYEDMANGVGVHNSKQSAQAKALLQSKLYPLQSQIQSQYGYNQTLTKR